MKRFLTSLFATGRGSRQSRPALPRARLQVESLEERALPAPVFAPSKPPAIVTANAAAISAWITKGMADAAKNPAVAVSDYNQAWALANRSENPGAFVTLAEVWAELPAAPSGYSGHTVDAYYNQAVGACYYWMTPTYGAGSGTNYAYGLSQLRGVINAAGTVATLLNGQAANAPYARYVTGLAQNAAAYVSKLDSQIVPPMAGGRWQINLGGTNITFTLRQHVGQASGTISYGTTTGTIEYTKIVSLPGYPNWFMSYFTIKWAGGGVLQGFAAQNAENSGQMTVQFWISSQNKWSGTVTANRISGDGWTSE